MTFEDDLRRLEEIAGVLGGDVLELDAALKLFEEGIALLRHASEQLAVADARVKVLVEQADNAIVTRDLDG